MPKLTKWTDEQLEFIKEYANVKSVEHMTKKLKCSRSQYRYAAMKYFGINVINARAKEDSTRWKENEVKILHEHYPDMFMLRMLISGKSDDCIYKKAQSEGLVTPHWTEEETARLIELYKDGKTRKELSKELSFPPKKISNKITLLKKHGILGDNSNQ